VPDAPPSAAYKLPHYCEPAELFSFHRVNSPSADFRKS
jgi:hypothetical protein